MLLTLTIKAEYEEYPRIALHVFVSFIVKFIGGHSCQLPLKRRASRVTNISTSFPTIPIL